MFLFETEHRQAHENKTNLQELHSYPQYTTCMVSLTNRTKHVRGEGEQKQRTADTRFVKD